MFRLHLLPLALLAVLITACQVTVRPPVPPDDGQYSINAQGRTTEPSVRRTITIPAHSVAFLDVHYPSSPADLMYLEIEPVGAGTGLQLEMWGAAGTARELVSRSPRLFATSTAPLGAAVETVDASVGDVERSSIAIGWTCFGPCVARSYRSGTTFARVVNASSSGRTVRIYAYGLDETDLNEPNDTVATATQVTARAIGDSVSGAIERVTDLDYFRIHCGTGFPGTIMRLTLATGFDGDMVLEAAGTRYRPGERTAYMPCGTTVLVRTADGSAGPSAASTYSILIE